MAPDCETFATLGRIDLADLPRVSIMLRGLSRAPVAELVDALDSKSSSARSVRSSRTGGTTHPSNFVAIGPQIDRTSAADPYGGTAGLGIWWATWTSGEKR